VTFYTGDHSQEELAKFGYRSEWKVILKKESCYIFGNLLMLISENNSSKSGNFGAFFFTKILCMSNIGFCFILSPSKNAV
jgi:hypothetical protein